MGVASHLRRLPVLQVICSCLGDLGQPALHLRGRAHFTENLAKQASLQRCLLMLALPAGIVSDLCRCVTEPLIGCRTRALLELGLMTTARGR